jgi:hypothetical protein
MPVSTSATSRSSKFAVKTEIVELTKARPLATTSSLTLGELEAMRAGCPDVPASRHGLEVICGGSCETGAQ